MENRYWQLELTEEEHWEQLQQAFKNGQLEGVVDENKGGIIAYVMGDTELEQLLKYLNNQTLTKDSIKQSIEDLQIAVSEVGKEIKDIKKEVAWLRNRITNLEG